VGPGDMSSKFPAVIEDPIAKLALVAIPLDRFSQEICTLFLEILRKLNLQQFRLVHQLPTDFLVDLVRQAEDDTNLSEDFFLKFLLVHLKVYFI
jgi:hypothetical protein